VETGSERTAARDNNGTPPGDPKPPGARGKRERDGLGKKGMHPTAFKFPAGVKRSSNSLEAKNGAAGAQHIPALSNPLSGVRAFADFAADGGPSWTRFAWRYGNGVTLCGSGAELEKLKVRQWNAAAFDSGPRKNAVSICRTIDVAATSQTCTEGRIGKRWYDGEKARLVICVGNPAEVRPIDGQRKIACEWNPADKEWPINISHTVTRRKLAMGALELEAGRRAGTRVPPLRNPKRGPQDHERNKWATSIRLRRLKTGKVVRGRRPILIHKARFAKSAARRDLLRGKTVIVVDEVSLSRMALARILRSLGYRVLEAGSGIEAQGLAHAEEPIDLLLVEFTALGTAGVELVRWFTTNRPETKVLVAAESLWEVEACLGDLPQLGVLAKPFTPAELVRMVRMIAE
jgi:CheY-like chemotaxis protein